MATLTTPKAVTAAGASRLIERFMPHADITECHEVLVRAPAALVFDVARNLDMQSIPLVRAIFWLRAKLLRATEPPARPRGLVAETTALGWAILAERPGREVVVGSATQPWKGDVVFRPVEPDRFVAFAEPEMVKIVWTLEAEPLGPALTRFRTETRVLATDEAARTQFRRYWRWAGWGVVLIRKLLLWALRGEAKRESLHHSSASGQRNPGSRSSPSSVPSGPTTESLPSAR